LIACRSPNLASLLAQGFARFMVSRTKKRTVLCQKADSGVGIWTFSMLHVTIERYRFVVLWRCKGHAHCLIPIADAEPIQMELQLLKI
jgi:hypothetical protein